MRELGLILLTNAATATVLGIAVACVARRLCRPQVVHALWVVVLLDLLVPPVLEVGVLPWDWLAAITTAAGETTAIELPTMRAPGPRLAPTIPALDGPPQPGRELPGTVAWIALLWLVGSASVLTFALLRAYRFAQTVRGARTAPDALQQRLATLAERTGLGRGPRLRLVRAHLSPMLRWHRGALEILFPLELLRRLAPPERDALLLHELAHVRRRDPWVRVLELAATCLFWWHPLVFWARRSLRLAEEMSCDAWVLRCFPGHGREYAKGLLKTVEFLAGSRSRLPALASGAGAFHSLEERLTMIVKDRRPKTLARPLRWALALAAVAGLLVFPIGASRNAQETGSLPGDIPPELQAEAEELAREMAALQERQLLLQLRMTELRAAGERAQLEVQASALRQAGEVSRAEWIEARAELAERAAELEAQGLHLEVDLRRSASEAEQALRELAERAASLEAEGEVTAAEVAREEAQRLATELASTADAGAPRHSELEAASRQLELAAMELEQQRQAAEGQALARDKTVAALDLHRNRLQQRQRELETQGRLAEAARLEQQQLELARRGEQERGIRREIEALVDALLDERLQQDERAVIDRELRRALAEVERSLHELHDREADRTH